MLENKYLEIYKFEGLAYIVGCRGASQLEGSLLGIPPGYKANKLEESLSYPLGIIFMSISKMKLDISSY